MEKRNIRLVAFDLDGTTLSGHNQLSKRNRLAMEKAAQAGVLMVPTTGRMKDFLPSCLTELPFIRYAITANGAATWDLHEGKRICDNLIPTETALKVQRIFDRYDNLYVEYYIDGHGVTLFGNPERAKTVCNMPKDKYHFLKKDYQFVEDFSAYFRETGVQPEKINLIYIPPEIQKSLFEDLQKMDDLTLTYSNVDNMEINAKNCDKGSGLRAFCNEMQIDIESTMAVGDNGNDLGMLQTAGFAVVVENGIAQAKAEADVVVASCMEDGFAEAVERFVL